MGLYTNIDHIYPPIVSGRCHEEERLGLAVIKRYVKPVANERRHKKTCSDFVFVLYIDNTLIRAQFKVLTCTIFCGCVAVFV